MFADFSTMDRSANADCEMVYIYIKPTGNKIHLVFRNMLIQSVNEIRVLMNRLMFRFTGFSCLVLTSSCDSRADATWRKQFDASLIPFVCLLKVFTKVQKLNMISLQLFPVSNWLKEMGQ